MDSRTSFLAVAWMIVASGCSQLEPMAETNADASTADDASVADANVQVSDAHISTDAASDATRPVLRDGCVPSTEVCDRVDNDCNGSVDDVDTGGDGICDCLSIGIIGHAGANPSARFAEWLRDNGTSVTRILDGERSMGGGSAGEDGSDTTLIPSLIAPYDVLIIDMLMRDFTEAEAGVIADYVAAGGGLISMTGHHGPIYDGPRQSTILQGMHVRYAGGDNPYGFIANAGTGALMVNTTHQTMMGTSDIGFYGGQGVFRTDVEDIFGVGEPDPRLTSFTPVAFVAATADGAAANTPNPTPVGVAIEYGMGHAFVWGDEWVSFDSEWTAHPGVKQFWVNMFAWTHPRTFCDILY